MSRVHDRLQFQDKMKSADIVRHAMHSEITRARKLLRQGLHDPTVMETLETLSKSLKLVTNFEMKLLAELDVD